MKSARLTRQRIAALPALATVLGCASYGNTLKALAMGTETVLPIAVPRGLAAIATNAPAVFLPNPKAAERFFDFFTANIRNRNTRRAYHKAACRFSDWCEGRGLLGLAQVTPPHVAAYIEGWACRRGRGFPSFR